jgi:hypothetical protein
LGEKQPMGKKCHVGSIGIWNGEGKLLPKITHNN